ncbi:MAG: parallel beta-helix domain-containing protein [Myxococcota bacterium]
MVRFNRAGGVFFALTGLATFTGCSSDDGPGVGDDVDTTGCDVVLEASGGDDYAAVQDALIGATSGSDVCFRPGAYSFSREVSLTVRDVTVRGLGATRDDTILDFLAQEAGDDGITVTSDGFTIENLWIKNTPGNGVVVTGAEDVTFRNLKVTWDAGSVTENGAYAVYPVRSRRVLIEDTEVVGAADAGLYVGQCQQAIVRNNDVHGNVAGIELENTVGGEVVNNRAYDNSAGILVFVLPNLEFKSGDATLVHDNEVYDNNRENFAEAGTIVAQVPPGTGVLLLAADGVEITNNDFRNNVSTSILAVSYDTLSPLLGSSPDDPETDLYLERIYVHDNTYTSNGTDPQTVAAALEISPLEDFVWDGVANADNPDGAQICFGSAPPSFRDFGGFDNIANAENHSTDASGHQCELPPVPPVSF